ncbi:MAG TPA: serine/threonine-protein kinase [Nocardioides sp.]|nr:serine/threonine-protein kinase [Nocardioides sp.]
MSSFSAPGYPAPGARIGRFLILDQLGQGGMGVVYRAREENLGREVALKIVAPLFAHDPEFRERFTREARAQASLDSSHVVAVYAHGEEDGYLYIASQLVVDGDLGRLIRTAGVPPLPDALDVIEQVASGLSDAHEAGLIHRDIKPGNVLVRLRGGAIRAYLADFGIARRVDADATRFGSAAVGTPSYMAPELHGGAPASVATDIYSLGCLLWVALSGTPPYQGSSEYQIIGGHIGAPVPQLPGDGPMVQATNRILRIAMAKEPAQRYASAAAMRADLQAALRMPSQAGSAMPAPPAGTVLRPLTPTGSRTPTGGPTPTPSRMPTVPPPSWQSHPTPTGPPRRASSKRLWIGVGTAAVLALAVGVGAAIAVGQGDGGGDPAPDPAAAFLDLPADQILTDSEKEMKVLDSARVQGSFLQDGSRLVVDLVVTTEGDCHGTMKQEGAGEIEMLRVGDRVFVKPDQQFLTSASGAGVDASTAQLLQNALHGRWLEFPKDENTNDLTKICDLDEQLERDGREDATATDVGTVEVNGKQTVKIELTEGTNFEAYYVQVDEPHYTLRVDESRTGDETLDYSEFDATPPIELPPADDSATLDQLISEISG